MPGSNEDFTVHYQDHYFELLGDSQQPHFIRVRYAAQCVPLTDSGMVIFIVEPSPAFGEEVLFLPGGQIEDGETAETAANRELQEEIGYKANRLDYLGELRPWVKYLHTRLYIYLARRLTPSKLHGDEIYQIRTELVPLKDFERLIASGRLHDSSVIASLYMARELLAKEELLRQNETA